MNKKPRGLLAITVIVLSAMLLSACTQSLSSAPEATPTPIPEGLFVSPFPSVDNPMAMIEEFAKQTAAAQTTIAEGGDPTTPQPVEEGTVITPENDVIETATPAVSELVSTPTNIISTIAPAATSVPPGTRPATYTLQKGEFPYCIARRFNVDPSQLLQANGMTTAQAEVYTPGTVLSIPQNAGPWPGDRARQAHPASYTVKNGDETIFSVACLFGDVDPNAIASTNNISVSSKLTIGQVLQIP